MSLPAPPRAAGPARSTPSRPGPLLDGYARVEHEVTRTADLVLKVQSLLERVEGLEVQPERAARMARLAWVVEHGQAALRRAADATPDGAVEARDGEGEAGDGVPRPRTRG